MYSKLTNDKNGIELPPNYGGSIFGRRESTPRFMPPQGASVRRPIVREYAPPSVMTDMTHENASESNDERCERDEPCDVPAKECKRECEQCLANAENKDERECEKKTSLFPSLSSIGTEELLLIAIALMVFQGGKEPDLALILLALLFIN